MKWLSAVSAVITGNLLFAIALAWFIDSRKHELMARELRRNFG